MAILIAIGITAVIDGFTADDQFTADNLVWVFLSIPVWIVIAKINDLYDRDQRRIQHSTFDEIPTILATAAITVVLVKLCLLYTSPSPRDRS